MATIGNRKVWEEREFIPTGKLGHADVSGWAKGVSRPWGSQFNPKRPECSGRVLSISRPVQVLANVKPVVSKPVKHNPASVVIPVKDKSSVDMSDANKTDEMKARAAVTRSALSDAFNRLYAVLGKTAEPVTVLR